MSYIKIWVHVVWATKRREPILTPTVRKPLIHHIRQNADLKDIWLEAINGHNDHLHVLIRLRSEQTISKVVQLLKGESAYWFNLQELSQQKLVWSKEYFAVSISESGIERVKKYIDNQEIHHQWKTFAEEYDEFIKAYDFVRLDDTDD